jgi:hypothetical protein
MSKTKATTAKSAARAKPSTSHGARSGPRRRKQKAWRWVVDNRMRDWGDIDFVRQVIRVNHAMHKREGERLIDTLFHEELHRLFPRLGERAICLMTKALLPTLSHKYKAQLYARIRMR